MKLPAKIMNMYKQLTMTILSFIMLNINSQAQNVSQKADSLGPFCLKNIDTWLIHSSTIGEDYTLYVLRTTAYDTSNIKLPVLYMTDGDWNMTVVMNCFSMLRQDYYTHEPLVVGIGYGKGKNQRFRDLDPATGGPAFLTFIEKEVMPFIAEKYRTTNEKAIYGYSMGGMFTTYILFNRPDLFDMVFIGAPANGGNQLMPSAEKYFTEHKNLKSKVFIGVGSYEKGVVKNINTFTDYLLSFKCPDLIVQKGFTPGASHGAALAQVMQNAIAFGYCERHTAIKINTDIYKQYQGKYISENKALPDVLILVEKNKLYWKFDKEGEIPTELIPVSKTQYFMTENERIEFTFKTDKNKITIIIVPEDKMEYYFTRDE